MKARLFLVGVYVMLAMTVSAQQTQYIIPVFGTGLEGADALWNSHILISNPQTTSVTVRVQQILTYASVACDCPGASSVVIPPRATRALEAVSLNGRLLRLGAVLLSADAPVTVESWVQGNAYVDNVARVQQVKIVTEWLDPTDYIWIPMIFGGLVPEATNLFLVNPNSFAIRVHYDGPPGHADYDVPAEAMVIERLTYTPVTPGGFPQGISANLTATAPFYALTSDGLLSRNPVTSP